uniref:Uncharacterized protein n=1 Tax=Anguilla anguilla TaxID=7936 RepID=A0A0E9Q8M4_ANGAN
MHARAHQTYTRGGDFFLNAFDYHSIMFQMICDSQGNY